VATGWTPPLALALAVAPATASRPGRTSPGSANGIHIGSTATADASPDGGLAVRFDASRCASLVNESASQIVPAVMGHLHRVAIWSRDICAVLKGALINQALRAAMAAAGHTVESLAAQVEVDPKTTARWLVPGRIPHPRHRTRAADALGRDVEDIWPDTSRRRGLGWFRPWAEIEREAVALRSYQLSVLPGLLQTEAYARAVLVGAGRVGRGDVERQLATRLARQAILTREDPPQLAFVIDEGVLRRPVGSPVVMREQLQTIAATCEDPHVRVQVVPSTVGAYAGLNGPFVLATNARHRTAGYLDNQLKGTVVTESDDVALMLGAWEAVRGEALSHWQSADLIKEVAQTWT